MINEAMERAVRHHGSQKRLANELGITQARISQLKNGDAPVSAVLALRIEKLTDGQVSATELCPTLSDLLPAA